jgi:hypothetical protein
MVIDTAPDAVSAVTRTIGAFRAKNLFNQFVVLMASVASWMRDRDWRCHSKRYAQAHETLRSTRNAPAHPWGFVRIIVPSAAQKMPKPTI